MRKVSSSRRSIGRSGSRGISSRPLRGFHSSTNKFNTMPKGYTSGYNRHHSHMYRRYYGNSILPHWIRVLFYILLTIVALFIL